MFDPLDAHKPEVYEPELELPDVEMSTIFISTKRVFSRSDLEIDRFC